jgi:hypothetical protein
MKYWSNFPESKALSNIWVDCPFKQYLSWRKNRLWFYYKELLWICMFFVFSLYIYRVFMYFITSLPLLRGQHTVLSHPRWQLTQGLARVSRGLWRSGIRTPGLLQICQVYYQQCFGSGFAGKMRIRTQLRNLFPEPKAKELFKKIIKKHWEKNKTQLAKYVVNRH